MKYTNENPPIVCMMSQSTCYKNTRTFTPKGILWHSTGANNPNLKRYVQPDDNASNRAELLSVIGKNAYANDWNHISVQAGLNAWVGKLADGTVTAVQTLPWNYRPWGCGSGSKGSCNDTHIQFEICEDALTDASYFNACYKEACEMTAYLCKMFGIDPKGTTVCNGVTVPTIIDHTGSCSYGLGSNHGDIQHWSRKYGKTMENVRDDVATLLAAETTTTAATSKKSGCTASAVIAVAESQLGYHEKASNANLDSNTANSGSSNYTKYANEIDTKYPNWYNGKKNGYAWCFTEDALVLTDTGYKKIQDIDIGDRVLSAHGDRFNKVTKIFVHDAEVKDYRFYGAIPFSATPDHPILSQKRKDKWHRKKGFADFGFHEIDELNKGDVAAVPHTPVLHNPGLSYDDWWVAGYFTGDGYWNPGRDSFELFANERKAVKVDVHARGRWEKDYASHTCKCFKLYRDDPKLMEVLRDCGHLAVNKRVPSAVLFGTQEAKRAFLDGYLAADGCENWNGFNSVSAELVTGIARLLCDVGTMCAINPQKRPPTGKIFDKRLNAWRTFNQQEVIYNCYVSVTEVERHQHYVAGDLYTFVPLREKGNEVRTDTVYTITTDGDHTYTVNNIGVHNCDVFVDWCFLTAFGYEKALTLLCQPEKSAGAGCTYSLGYFKAKGQFYTKNPKPGDQIFFGTSLSNSTHTGLVVKVDGSTVYTIEGNTSDQVARRSYALGSSNILGYGRPAYDAESGTADTTTTYYRVRKSWSDKASQIGAYTVLKNAKNCVDANPGYAVFDDSGNQVYPAGTGSFQVSVSVTNLNIRTGPGTNYSKTGKYTGKGVFTIVEVASGAGSSSGWGKLKSGAGWIALDYATKL